MARLGDLVTRVRNVGPDSPAGIFTYIDLSSVDALSKTITTPKELAITEAPSRARQRVQRGDVLVSTVRPNLNGVARVPGSLAEATASTGFCVLRPDSARLDSDYLFHWVKSDSFVDEMVRRATGASYPAVSDPIVKSSEIPLPPLPEQRRIASILDQADELRAKRRRALAFLDDLADSIFTDLASREEWPVSALGEVAQTQGGITVNRVRAGYSLQVSYLRVANVMRRRLDLTEVKQIGVTEGELARVQLRQGDLLIVEGHGNHSEVGRAGRWPFFDKRMVHQNHLIRVRALPARLDSVYLAAYLNGEHARRYFQSVAKTTSGLNTINMTNVKEVPIPVPPLLVQEEFAARIAAISLAKSAYHNQLARLDDLFASLQYRAFRGEL